MGDNELFELDPIRGDEDCLQPAKAEIHDKNDPISRKLAIRQFEQKVPRTVQVRHAVDVITCDICREYAKFRHFGIFCCKKCAEIVVPAVRSRVVPTGECVLMIYFAPSTTTCKSCVPCRMKKCVEDIIEIRDTRKRLIEEENIEHRRLLEEARREFITSRADNIEIEQYFPDGNWKKCRSMQHLNDAFDESCEKLLQYIGRLNTLRILTNADRTRLVRSYASQHFILEILRRSSHLKDSTIANVIELDSAYVYDVADKKLRRSSMGKFFCEMILPLASAMRKFGVDDEDHAYLRACCFFNPEVPDLENKKYVDVVHEFFVDQFRQYLYRETRKSYKKLRIFKEAATMAAGGLLILLRGTHTQKSDLMRELVKHKDFEKK